MSNTPEDTELRQKIVVLLFNASAEKENKSIGQAADEIMNLITLHTQQAYLVHFEYEDWQLGDDNKLRVGDYIYCNYQRPDTGAETFFEGQIVEHHCNEVPLIIYNVDHEYPDDSGDYVDLQSLMMGGWTFTRIAQLTNPTEGGDK